MPNHEDFELKKLLINIIVLLSRDPSILPVSEITYQITPQWITIFTDISEITLGVCEVMNSSIFCL
jgi:hypothetical protein